MSEAKNTIPYKVQKGNRPKIEEIISACLNSDLHDNAMDFALWMRENNMPLKLYSSSTRNHTVGYKGMALCRTIIAADDDLHNNLGKRFPPSPQHWVVTIFISDVNKYENSVADEKMKNFVWGNLNECGQCSSKCSNIGGKTLTLFDKEIENACNIQCVVIKNPDETAITNIKKMLVFEKRARDEIG